MRGQMVTRTKPNHDFAARTARFASTSDVNWSTKSEGTLSKLQQLTRFGLVGFAAFLVDASVLSALVWVGFPVALARVPSVMLSIFTTWTLNRKYTFRTSTKANLSEFLKYTGAIGVGISVNYGVFLLALGLSQTVRDMPVIGLVISTLAAMSLNYLSARFLLNR